MRLLLAVAVAASAEPEAEPAGAAPAPLLPDYAPMPPEAVRTHVAAMERARHGGAWRDPREPCWFKRYPKQAKDPDGVNMAKAAGEDPAAWAALDLISNASLRYAVHSNTGDTAGGCTSHQFFQRAQQARRPRPPTHSAHSAPRTDC